jgi:hypothetical protein
MVSARAPRATGDRSDIDAELGERPDSGWSDGVGIVGQHDRAASDQHVRDAHAE